MKTAMGAVVLLLIGAFGAGMVLSSPFGLAENSLRDVKAVRFENIYTQVPTSGKLVSLKITDAGKTYYICQEKSGYVVYHLEIRPIEELKPKLEEELKEFGQKWDAHQPDELLFTKERYSSELRKRIHRYSEAVWVREEVVVGQSPRPQAGDKDAKR